MTSRGELAYQQLCSGMSEEFNVCSKQVLEMESLIQSPDHSLYDLAQIFRGVQDQEKQKDSILGGQKKRVAITRAILKHPRILLLDEATSALDAEYDIIVQEALHRIMVNRTTVIVAHSLSTIKNADTIVVIHQGKIIERGSYAQLTRDPDGAYSQVISLQEMKGS